MNSADRYRRLPGRRRGWFRSASVWMGADHLLSVKSLRFREDYRRFHFRDIQAIVIARAPRFHVTPYHLLAALALLAAWLLLRARLPQYAWIFPAAAALGVLAWLLVSARFSCRCRLYTSVSSEELPSIYRTWIAGRFLQQVTPAIAGVQGNLAPGWVEAAEQVVAGPAAGPRPREEPEAATRPAARIHTLAADLFIATLWLTAAADLLSLHSTTRLAHFSQLAAPLVLLTETVFLFVEHYRGLLRSPLRNLAIANLIAMGAMYYVGQMVFSLNSARNAQVRVPLFYYTGSWMLGIDAGICIILGLVGLGIVFLRHD